VIGDALPARAGAASFTSQPRTREIAGTAGRRREILQAGIEWSARTGRTGTAEAIQCMVSRARRRGLKASDRGGLSLVVPARARRRRRRGPAPIAARAPDAHDFVTLRRELPASSREAGHAAWRNGEVIGRIHEAGDRCGEMHGLMPRDVGGA